MFVKRGMLLAGIGVALGLAAAFPLTQLMTAVLYGVGPHDPLTLAGVAAILVGAAALASWIPARRASRIDPVQTLRGD